jgi:glycosyltransferase involved in cell wall biosynthesis
MLSVIIPTYNRAALLKQALASVLAQIAPATEILVIDDGSSDETPAIVNDVLRQGHPLRYIVQENKGAAAARNRGLAEARYNLLCFLDSDDTWHKRKLQLQVQAMQEAPRFLISHTQETWFRQGQYLNQKKKHAPAQGYIFERALGICVVGMSTVMARRELFDRYGLFDESLPCCEDYDFWLRVAVQEEFLLIEQPLTIKNGGRADQLSVIHRLGMDLWRIRSLCKLLEQAPLKPEQYQAAYSELQRKCSIYGQGCLKHGKTEEGTSYLALPQRFSLEQTGT